MLNVPRLFFYVHPLCLCIYIPIFYTMLGFELDIQKANCCEAKNTCVRNGYQLVVNQREVQVSYISARVTPALRSVQAKPKEKLSLSLEFRFGMNNAIDGMIGPTSPQHNAASIPF